METERGAEKTLPSELSLPWETLGEVTSSPPGSSATVGNRPVGSPARFLKPLPPSPSRVLSLVSLPARGDLPSLDSPDMLDMSSRSSDVESHTSLDEHGASPEPSGSFASSWAAPGTPWRNDVLL